MMIRAARRGIVSITGLQVVSTLIVAGIAAWSSYWHLAHVAVHYGERPEVAYAMPASVDGMLLVASAAMMQDRRARLRVRPLARVSFAVGVVASVGANIAGAQPDLPSRLVAAWPAVALLLVVEMLTAPGRPRTPTAVEDHTPPATEPDPEREILATADPALDPHHTVPPSATHPAAAPPSGTGSSPAQPPPPPNRPSTPPPAPTRRAGGVRAGAATGRGHRRPAAETYALAQRLLEADPTMSRTELAARVGVTPSWLRKVIRAATTDVTARETPS